MAIWENLPTLCCGDPSAILLLSFDLLKSSYSLGLGASGALPVDLPVVGLASLAYCKVCQCALYYFWIGIDDST